jgi:hypothetical protein
MRSEGVRMIKKRIRGTEGESIGIEEAKKEERKVGKRKGKRNWIKV